MKELFENETIRCLSWYQPYASLMLHGKIETRKYPTKVRGKVLICSGKRQLKEFDLFYISGERQTGRIYEALRVSNIKEPLGMAIAIGDLVDCRPMTKEDADKCYVRYREDIKLWCWIFENIRAIEPFEIRGKQGWGILDEQTKSKIIII